MTYAESVFWQALLLPYIFFVALSIAGCGYWACIYVPTRIIEKHMDRLARKAGYERT